MKISEQIKIWRGKSKKDLEKELSDFSAKISHLHMSIFANKEKSHHTLSLQKKNYARIITIINEKSGDDNGKN